MCSRLIIVTARVMEKKETTALFLLMVCFTVLDVLGFAQADGSALGVNEDATNHTDTIQNTPTGVCQYEYTEQPPHQIHCNPYLNTQLRLECTIEVPPNRLPQVVWFRSRLQEGQQSGSHRDWWIMERLDGSQPDILVREQHRVSSINYTMRSQLQISSLDNADIGDYWCRILLEGTQWLVPSDSFYLQHRSTYTHYSACTTRFAQSKLERKCASWDPGSITATNSTTSAGDQSTTTNAVDVDETTQPTQVATEEHYSTTQTIVTTQVPNTKERATWTTTGPDVTEHPNSVAVTRNSTEEVPSPHTASQTNPTLLEANKGSASDDTTGRRSSFLHRKELYISVAVLLLFGVLVLILVPVTICLCIRKRGRKGMRARHNTYMENQATDDLEEEPTTPTTPASAASDYLVPLPLLNRQHQQLHQFPRLPQLPKLPQLPRLPQRSRSLQHSYETTISLSHEYEDVPDLIEAGTGDRSKEGAYSYDNDDAFRMNRNAAYKVNRTWDSRHGAALLQCHDMVIPNPMNCFYNNNNNNFPVHVDEQEHSTTDLQTTRL